MHSHQSQRLHEYGSALKQSKQLLLSSSRFGSFVHGWHLGTTGWTALAILALIINTALTIAVATTYGFQDGVGTLKQGDCNCIQRNNTAFHVVINVLSAALLAGSNYCMQCLSAPSREEVDRAHEQGVALDIGIPSLTNFKYLRISKLISWLLFAFSSLPLHILYVSKNKSSTSSRYLCNSPTILHFIRPSATTSMLSCLHSHPVCRPVHST